MTLLHLFYHILNHQLSILFLMHLKLSCRCQFSSSYIFLYAYNYLLPEKPVCRSRSNSKNWTWNNGLFQNWERSTSRLYIISVYYLFLLYAGYIMWIAELDDSQAGIKISGKNINNLRYVDDITVTAKSDETKEPLDNSERGEWKIWLKTQCSKN